MAVGCTRSNLCTSLIKSPVSSSHVSSRYWFVFLQNWSKISCKKFTLTLTDLRMTQKALSQTMVTRDGRRIVTRWLSTMFFFWDQSEFYCPGRNCSWLLHIGNLMSWLWKYQTLIISWAATAPTCGMMPWFWSCCFNRAFSCCNVSTWQNPFKPILTSLLNFGNLPDLKDVRFQQRCPGERKGL